MMMVWYGVLYDLLKETMKLLTNKKMTRHSYKKIMHFIRDDNLAYQLNLTKGINFGNKLTNANEQNSDCNTVQRFIEVLI